MKRKNKVLMTLGILILAGIVVLLWVVQLFTLNAYVCSAPIPEQTTDPPEGQVALSAIEMFPSARIPVTFTSVEVRDTVTGETLNPGLVLYDEEPVHLLMASSWVGTPEDFEKEFSESPQLPVEGGKLTSKAVVLGTLWSHWPDWNHPVEYTFRYKLFGLFPKTEHMVYDWTWNSEAADE